jgi:phage terminase large subunit
MSRRLINKNFKALVRTYRANRDGGFMNSHHCILEGSSRSGKTISTVDFIIWYCLMNTNKTIFVIRETYNSHKTSLYTDFHNRLKTFGMSSPFDNAKEVSQFSINGNNIFFLGADKPDKFEGAGCDLAYFNEILDIDKPIFDHVEQRCREMFIGDFNPKYTIHWVFDNILLRNDVIHIHSTFHDNPFISATEKKKILSYQPTVENIKQGTADDFRWNVYGLGLRFAPSGLIFPRVKWIDEFPTEVERIFYGLDYGKTVDPSALVKVGILGRKIYAQEMLYLPTEFPEDLINVMPKEIHEQSVMIWDDLAEPVFRSKLRECGYNIAPAKKFAGCIKYRCDLINTFDLHIVRSRNFEKEIQNYSRRVVHGVTYDEPDPNAKNNHLIDALGYACQSELRADE